MSAVCAHGSRLRRRLREGGLAGRRPVGLASLRSGVLPSQGLCFSRHCESRRGAAIQATCEGLSMGHLPHQLWSPALWTGGDGPSRLNAGGRDAPALLRSWPGQRGAGG